MSDLGTALRELVDRQQPVGGHDPGQLWAQGRQRVRRRRALGAAVAVIALGVVGIGTLVVPEPVVVMPAGQVHLPGYPEHVYRPNRWLAGTDDQGPLGQLALISTAEHGSRSGVFGISATTGEYRFLDLPGWVEGSQATLAPDGKHVAYWTTGHTWSTPYPDPGLGSRGGRAIAGMAIYDTVTGDVQRTKLLTMHGLRGENLFWVDSGTVYFGDWELKTRTGSSRSRFLAVSVGEPQTRDIDVPSAALMDGYRSADGSFVVPGDDGLTWASSPGPGAGDTRPIHLPATDSAGSDLSYTYVSRAAGRVAVTVDSTTGLYGPVLVGDVDARGKVSGLDLVSARFQNTRILGWHDDHTLLAYGTYGRSEALASIDVRTGKLTTDSTDLTDLTKLTDPQVASDVLRGDLVAGRKPPAPMDPRLRNSLVVAGGLTLAGGVLLLTRRRRRA